MTLRIPPITTPIAGEGDDADPRSINSLWYRYLQALQPSISSAGIPDAPNDGQLYGRRNQAWQAINTFTPTVAGFVPAPGSVSNRFLRDDGTWQVVGTASAAAPDFSIQYNGGSNTFAGSSNYTFDGSSLVSLTGTQRFVGNNCRIETFSDSAINPTLPARLTFQSYVPNTATLLQLLPNGTGSGVGIAFANKPNGSTANFMSWSSTTDRHAISLNNGSGIAGLPFEWQQQTVGGLTVQAVGTIHPSGNWNLHANRDVTNPPVADPGYKLNVGGTFNVTGRIFLSGSAGTAGQVLTSGGAGAPSWTSVGGGVTDGDKGDITVSGAGTVWTIDNQAVTLAKIQNIASARFLGRVTALSGVTEELTGTQATTLLDTFTSALKGLVPASGGGTTNFLRADGTWAAPPGGGGGTPGGANTQVQYNNAGAFGGITNLLSNGTDVTFMQVAGNQNFTGNSRRLFAPMSSGATTDFQFSTTVANSNTNVQAVPNGTGTSAAWRVYSANDSTNASYAQLASGASAQMLSSSRTGTGTVLPLNFGIGTGPTVYGTLFTNGNWNFGPTTTDPGIPFRVEGLARFNLGAAACIGIDIASSAWGSNYRGVECGRAGSAIVGNTVNSALQMTSNCYWNGTNWIYANTGSGAGQIDLRNSFGVAVAASGTAGNVVTFTNVFNVSSAGAVTFPSVGTTASAANAFLDNAASNNLLRSTSSIRYKQDVQDIPSVDLSRFRPITYRSKAEADDPDRRWFGFIAEEVAEIEPTLVHYDAEGRPDGVQYDRLTVLLVKKIQELEARLAAPSGTAGTSATLTTRFRIDTSGNTQIGSVSAGASATNTVVMENATAPTTSPAGAGQLYVSAGALVYRGSSGTVTTIAPA